MKDKLDQLFSLEEQIHQAFGYQQQWRIYPIVDMREFHWHVEDFERLRYWDTRDQALARDQKHEYEADVSGLGAMRIDGFAMILMDTNTDGNVFLGVFDETKELKELPSEPDEAAETD